MKNNQKILPWTPIKNKMRVIKNKEISRQRQKADEILSQFRPKIQRMEIEELNRRAKEVATGKFSANALAYKFLRQTNPEWQKTLKQFSDLKILYDFFYMEMLKKMSKAVCAVYPHLKEETERHFNMKQKNHILGKNKFVRKIHNLKS